MDRPEKRQLTSARRGRAPRARREGKGEGPSPSCFREITRALARWYRVHRRDLPWRRTSDPWAIWISEAMLQQTTVPTVVARWGPFLERFPTVHSLAAASEREVLAAWSGLGYYTRARNLHRAARQVAAQGAFPRTEAEWRELPGVGPYTAAAVASIAFSRPAAVVDGNVIRVVCRLFALSVSARAPATRALVQEKADALLSPRRPGDHNQAVMELGATVCTPRAPRCGACPLRRRCAAAAQGRPLSFPSPAPRPPARRLRLAAGVSLRAGRVLVVPDRHLVKGHLVVPLASVGPGEDAASRLADTFRVEVGRTPRGLRFLGRLRHSVLQRRYEVEVFRVDEGRAAPRPPARRLAIADLAREPHGGLLRKLLRALAPGGTLSSG